MVKELFFKIKYFLFLRNNLHFNKTIRNNSRLKKDALEELNWNKRKEIVNFAYANIPFYKEYYDKCNFNPSQLKSEIDWNLVPILEKEMLRDNSGSLINPNLSYNQLKKSTTGGSTGMPITVYFDKRIALDVFSWRVLDWWNTKPWGNQAFIFRNTRIGYKKLMNDILWWPTRRLLLDASKINEKDIKLFLTKFNKLKPELLQGYVGGVYEVARYISKNGLVVCSPKAIWVTSAPLSENQRTYIESVFNAPVYDQYGCGEVFWLAAECGKKEGLHVFSDLRHIEFIDNQNNIILDSDYGDVLITDLENRAFPIIRYKNGDRGRHLLQHCSCRRPFPLIDKIRGRTTDNIYTPSGSIVEGSYLTTIFDDYPELVSHFQLVQSEDFSIEIKCVLNDGIDENAAQFDGIKANLRRITNSELPIKFSFVPEIKSNGGKLKYIISELDENRH